MIRNKSWPAVLTIVTMLYNGYSTKLSKIKIINSIVRNTKEIRKGAPSYIVKKTVHSCLS